MGSVTEILRQAFALISSLIILARILRIEAQRRERAKPLKPQTIAIWIFEVQKVIKTLATEDRKVPAVIILKGEILSPKKPLIIWNAP